MRIDGSSHIPDLMTDDELHHGFVETKMYPAVHKSMTAFMGGAMVHAIGGTECLEGLEIPIIVHLPSLEGYAAREPKG